MGPEAGGNASRFDVSSRRARHAEEDGWRGKWIAARTGVKRVRAPRPVVSASRAAVPGDLEAALVSGVGGEVRFDAYTRHMYATDASMYAIEPIAVVFPRDADDVAAAVGIAGRFGAPVLPRGAGTGLAGQTVNHAVVLDFSRHMHAVLDIDPEAATARVQPGLVQDEIAGERVEAGAGDHLVAARADECGGEAVAD
jgi:hypothetical protein